MRPSWRAWAMGAALAARQVGTALAARRVGAWAVAAALAAWGLGACAPPWAGRPGTTAAGTTAAANVATRADAHRYVAYFLRDTRLVPVAYRSERPLSLEEAARAAFQALCNGPPPGLASAVRRGCRVERVWRTGDTLHVQVEPPDWDFVPGVPAANAWDDQMEMTAAQFPGVRRLQFWTGGRPRPGGPMPVDGRPNYLKIEGGHRP